MDETFDSVWDALFDDPAEIAVCEAKSQLMDKVEDYINKNNLTQQEAAEQMGVSQPRVSDITRGKLSKFTIDALVGMLAQVGISVAINVMDEETPSVESRKEIIKYLVIEQYQTPITDRYDEIVQGEEFYSWSILTPRIVGKKYART